LGIIGHTNQTVKPLDAYDKAYETGVFFTDSDTEWWLFSPVPKRKIAKNVSNGNELSRYNAKSIVINYKYRHGTEQDFGFQEDSGIGKDICLNQ
jgi:hypothetical protein